MEVKIPEAGTIIGWWQAIVPVLKRAWMALCAPVVDARLQPTTKGGLRLVVRNIWGGTAVPRVTIEDITDTLGRSTEMISTPAELYPISFARLSGSARAIYEVLSPQTDSSGTKLVAKTVTIERKEDGTEIRKEFPFLLNNPDYLDPNTEFRVELRVAFYDPDNQQKPPVDEWIQYAVTPAPGGGRMRRLRPRTSASPVPASPTVATGQRQQQG